MQKFRIKEQGWGGRYTFERCEGNFGGVMNWRVIDWCDNLESAEDRLAVAEGRMTKEDAAKRHRQRRKASKQMKDEDLQSLHRTPGVVAWKT